jgi:hypothetical protein
MARRPPFNNHCAETDSIVLGTIDAASQRTAISCAVAQGIKVIGWQSAGARPAADLNLITNIESDPRRQAREWRLHGGHRTMASGRRRLRQRTRLPSTRCNDGRGECRRGLNVPELVDNLIAEVQTRMPITTGLYQQYGPRLN